MTLNDVRDICQLLVLFEYLKKVNIGAEIYTQLDLAVFFTLCIVNMNQVTCEL